MGVKFTTGSTLIPVRVYLRIIIVGYPIFVGFTRYAFLNTEADKKGSSTMLYNIAMPMKKLIFILSLGITLFIGCVSNLKPIGAEKPIVLEGAAIFDCNSQSFLPNSVVVIQGERILRVGKRGDFQYPKGATVYNLRGKFIIPGLIDMHVHVRPSRLRREIMSKYLASGITTIRSPGSSDPAGGIELRDLIASGEIIGPKMFTAGQYIDGDPSRFDWTVKVRSEEAMRAEVRRQAEQGVDMIKLYWDVSPELLGVAVNEAHLHGLKVVGHLRTTSWTEAAQLGIDGLVHCAADGPTWELVEDEQVRARLFGQDPPRPGQGSLSPADYYSLWSESVDLNGPRMDSLVAALVRNDVTVDPTLVIMKALYYGDDLNVLRNMHPDRSPAAVLETWGEGWQKSNPFVTQNPLGVAQNFTSGKMMMPVAMNIVRILHERGVRITAGSDFGMPWVTPGDGLHYELQLMTEAGIPANEVLVIATKNAAEGLGIQANTGTIAAGKLADLVILSANPLEDIRNTRSVEFVFRSGQRYDPDSLLEVINQTH
ncbi:MAG: hypothetical protein EP344_19890 [Bacteroidetes bacterium]|nr:MAG: hypothetical protein EP344_19890 [Bacteroidota bacterium]